MMKLLPFSASTLQRDLDQSIGPQIQTQQTITTIPGIKYNPPDFMLPWLIWEYGLEQLLPYLSDPRLAIQEGVRWQRIRGTPASLAMALGWLGLADITIEPEVPGEHFYQYQVDTGAVVLAAQLDNVKAVAGFSAPLRSRLSRLYHGFDVRRLVLDDSDYGALLSDYSGVRKDGLVLSFGRYQSSEAHWFVDDRFVGDIGMGIVSSRGKQVQDVNWPTLDNQPLGGNRIDTARHNLWQVSASTVGQPWLGQWDQRAWNDATSPVVAVQNNALDIPPLRSHSSESNHPFADPGLAISITRSDGNINLNAGVMPLSINATRMVSVSNIHHEGLLGGEVVTSVREDERGLGITVKGQFWSGHWDQRIWDSPDYLLIGVAYTTSPNT
jgi:hypothetical protein